MKTEEKQTEKINTSQLTKREIPGAFVFSLDKNLPFQIHRSGISAFSEMERANAILQKFLRRLEKRFGDVIWYIGTDVFSDSIYERFVFNKGGFMEIKIGNNASVDAFFNTEERANEFKKALARALNDIKR